jgi:elongation factor G
MYVTVRPRSDDDREKLQRALSDLARQDPGMQVDTSAADSGTIVRGWRDLHLEIICERISREFNIPIDVGPFTTIYLETIRRNSEAEGRYIRQVGGRGQYAHVRLRLSPKERGSGYEFVDETKAGAVPPGFVEAVNLGIQEAMRAGILGGHEMVDLRAALCDGSYHAEDSNNIAFQIAGAMAFKEAARKASPVALEPMMALEVFAPENFAGAIMSDLTFRRGRIEGIEHRGGKTMIRATVPLATTIGYGKYLRSVVQRGAGFDTNFVGYEVLPPSDGLGGDEAGVTANKPRRPKAGSGTARAEPHEE